KCNPKYSESETHASFWFKIIEERDLYEKYTSFLKNIEIEKIQDYINEGVCELKVQSLHDKVVNNCNYLNTGLLWIVETPADIRNDIMQEFVKNYKT
ncbi:26108_t:CDS:2, partial [Racocetra persica]